MKTFSEILKERNEEEGGYGTPSITGQEAINILKNYLLGEDWYALYGICNGQVNAEIVHEILLKYSKRYRKEIKKERKKRHAR